MITDHHFKALNILGRQSRFAFAGPADWRFPIALTAQELAEWYWRIKKWYLVAGFSATAGGHTAEYPDGIITGTTASVELDIAVTGAFFDGAFPFTSPAPPGTTVSSGHAFVLFSSDAGPYLNEPGSPDYYPAIKIEGGCFAQTPSPDPVTDSAGVSFSSDPGAFGTDNETTATIYGKTMPLYWRESPDPAVGDGHITHTGLTITPYEWWPYEAADASPIYNTSTGAELQSPLN